MKKILVSILIILGYFTYSVEAIEVKVSTPLPLGSCSGSAFNSAWKTCDPNSESWCFYKCNVEPGFQSVSWLLWELIKFATFLAALASVLFIVFAGIRYTMSGTSGDSDEAKKKIQEVAVGLVLLFLSGYILYFIAPWIYKI